MELDPVSFEKIHEEDAAAQNYIWFDTEHFLVHLHSWRNSFRSEA